MTFTNELRRLLPASFLTNSPPLTPTVACGESEKRSIFDMARDPHQLDELLIKLQVSTKNVNVIS